jgi:hypothetical protein
MLLSKIKVIPMATKGKTRGPQEGKYVKRASKDDAAFATKKKRKSR